MEVVRYDVREEQLYKYDLYPEHENTKPTMNGDLQRHNIKDGVSSSSSHHPVKQKVVCCFCFKTTKLRRKQYIVSFFTNLGIFSLLLGYTFLGSFIFLAIEGGNNNQILRPRMLPGKQFTGQSNSESQINGSQREEDRNVSEDYNKRGTKSPEEIQNYSFLNDVNAEARARTVENIWEITVSLNILYRENWTRLAGQEISKFQDELVQKVTQEMAAQYGVAYREMALGGTAHSIGLTYGSDENEWSLAKSFFYSLTVLTTIGYGSIAPQTTLGKGVTIGYALFGIPLTMLYLTSVGTMLSRVARGAFSKALCCCLCSNCGYCCYDERRMAEKERRMKLKRQQEEIRALQSTSNISTSIQSQKTNQENFFVKPDGSAVGTLSGSRSNLNKDLDTLSWPDTDSKLSMHGLSILAPILLCLCIMFIYIVIGTVVLFKLDNLRIVDGFYFCFMSLSTIGFGSLVPGTGQHPQSKKPGLDNTTLWFCSIYILAGLALTAMCFNVVHDEIVHRIKFKQKQWSQKGNTVKDEKNLKDPFYIAS